MSIDPVSALPSRPSPGAAGARLGELYAAHSRMVYGICRMLLRDADEAEDVTQQVYLSAYSNLLTGTEVRDPAAWLGTIARNACRRRAADRMREPLATGDEPMLVAPAADETAIGRENAAALYAQLAVLPEKQREAVVLRDLYGLQYDEVARALGTSRPAVEALLFRGRRRLQRRLRPGLAAGVLVVPLTIRESIAYAVPGFAGTAPAGAATATAAGIPLAAKLAAAGSAVAIAGSAGFVAERSLHDPPSRPSAGVAVDGDERTAEAHALRHHATLMPVPPGGFPLLAARADSSGPGGGDKRRAAAVDENEDDDRHGGDDEDREDNSGPSGGRQNEVEDDEHEDEHVGEVEEDDEDRDGGGESDSSGRGSDEKESSHDE